MTCHAIIAWTTQRGKGGKMDAFEELISLLLRGQGFWTIPNYKVELTREDKLKIGRPSSPRWELDIVGYQGSTNKIYAVECKSYLDSTGVVFRNGDFEPPHLYKLFTDPILREVVFSRLKDQLYERGFCGADPTIIFCLAAGKIASRTNKKEMEDYFATNGWELFDQEWIREQLGKDANGGYENNIAHMVSKLLIGKG